MTPPRTPNVARRLVFAWDIGATWQLGTDPANASEVEVRFSAWSAERTLVEIEHRHLDRHGRGWQSLADGVDGEAGWPLYLGRYTQLISAEVAK